MVCKRSGIPNPGFLLTSHRLHCSSCPATESLFTFKTNVTKTFFHHIYEYSYIIHTFIHRQRNFAPFKVSFWILFHIQLTLSFLIGQKHTMNFRNQHLGRHLAADYTIIMSRSWVIMSCMTAVHDFLMVVMSSLCTLCCLLSVTKT